MAARKQNRKHIARVKALGCIVCVNRGFGIAPPEYISTHHIRTGYGWSQRAPDEETLGLCPTHHQYSAEGEIAYHDRPKEFERRYGTELELLEQVRRMLGIPPGGNYQ